MDGQRAIIVSVRNGWTEGNNSDRQEWMDRVLEAKIHKEM
jgi:hypothetical protein